MRYSRALLAVRTAPSSTSSRSWSTNRGSPSTRRATRTASRAAPRAARRRPVSWFRAAPTEVAWSVSVLLAGQRRHLGLRFPRCEGIGGPRRHDAGDELVAEPARRAAELVPGIE